MGVSDTPFYRTAGFGILTALVIAIVFGGYLNPGGSVTSVLTLFFLQFSCVGGFRALTESADDGMGGEWVKGLGLIPDVFGSVGGMIAALPLVVPFFEKCFTWFYYIGSTPAHAACAFLDPTMQAGTVAEKAVQNDIDVSYPASALAYFLGDFIAFSLPVGLLIVKEPESRRYLLLGLVPGVFCIPVACGVTYAVLALSGGSDGVYVNSKLEAMSGPGEANPTLDYALKVDVVGATLAVVSPCWILGGVMALALWLQPPEAHHQKEQGALASGDAAPPTSVQFAEDLGGQDAQNEQHDHDPPESLLVLRVFVGFGTALNFFLRASFLLSALEYIGGLSYLFELFNISPLLQFQPLLPNSSNQRYYTITNDTGLSVAASIGVALSGMMPFMHVLREHYLEQICRVGRKIGFTDPEGHGVLGMLGTLSSMMVLFRLMPKIAPRECVLSVAFSISASYILGGHLAFSSLYQPPLCVPLLVGKLVGGLCGMGLASITTCRLVEEEHEMHSEETVERRMTVAQRMSGIHNLEAVATATIAAGRFKSALQARLSSRIGERPIGEGPRAGKRRQRRTTALTRVNNLRQHMTMFEQNHNDEMHKRVRKHVKKHHAEEKAAKAASTSSNMDRPLLA
eukprot:g19102.t1